MSNALTIARFLWPEGTWKLRRSCRGACMPAFAIRVDDYAREQVDEIDGVPVYAVECQTNFQEDSVHDVAEAEQALITKVGCGKYGDALYRTLTGMDSVVPIHQHDMGKYTEAVATASLADRVKAMAETIKEVMTSRSHVWYQCPKPCEVMHCPYCEGGLANCTRCGCAEGSLPTECPGTQVSGAVQELIYRHRLDFIDGMWQNKETK